MTGIASLLGLLTGVDALPTDEEPYRSLAMTMGGCPDATLGAGETSRGREEVAVPNIVPLSVPSRGAGAPDEVAEVLPRGTLGSEISEETTECEGPYDKI